jgi:hypothetical protein
MVNTMATKKKAAKKAVKKVAAKKPAKKLAKRSVMPVGTPPGRGF